MSIFRPIITDNHINQINDLIKNNPDWHRTRLSVELCKTWDWRSPVGVWKDISCRDLLRDLEKAGQIVLPPARHVARITGAGPERVERIEHNITPVKTNLHQIMPLEIEIVKAGYDVKQFKSYIAQYHYLGYERSIGESMMYIIRSSGGIALSCMMFGAAAWKCLPRDEYIGWDDIQRRALLQFITNNVRNLIFPWVRVPHLASHILGAIARRISRDWQAKYGHGLYLLETFVERQKFRGVCYKAANWVNVGVTTGRGRNSVTSKPTLPIKDVWLYPTCAEFRKYFCS